MLSDPGKSECQIQGYFGMGALIDVCMNQIDSSKIKDVN